MVDVSIVICTRNRCAQLGQALEAVAGVRSHHTWEAIVIDNASSDDTASVIASFAARDPRFRHVHEAQQGLGAARDTAWRHASGAIVSFTDDDCYVAEDFVDRIVEAFAERPQAGYLGGRILLHDPSDAPVTIMTREQAFDIAPRAYIPAGLLQGANLSFRREVLEAIGGLSRDMGAGTPFPCEDVDAVATASWQGFAGGYDPRPVVSHHHGRKAAQVPSLRAGYDAGRAAYLAKFMAKPESRKAYFAGFVRQPLAPSVSENVARTWRYVVHGTRYLRSHEKTAAVPLLATAIAVQAVAGPILYLKQKLQRLRNGKGQLHVYARPGRNGINPFTGLLADAIERHGGQVHDVRLSRWNLPFSRSVLLLHWPDELYRNPKSLKVLVVAYLWLLHMTLAKLLAGLAVVWVAHNAVPHGDAPDVPPLRWKWFLRLLDGVIVLSQEGKREVLAAHPSLAAKRWLVTTHGHYLDRALTPPAMPPLIGDRPVKLAALGSVRANKRFVDLARAVSESTDNVELTVTGNPESQALADELAAIAASCPRIALHMGYLTDEQMEKATDAADLVVLPYANILNSGVLFYALSRYRPVIAPRLGSIPEVAQQIGSDWITLFDGRFDANVLGKAVRWLRQSKRSAPPNLSAQDWDTIGKDVSRFLGDLVQRGSAAADTAESPGAAS